MAKCECHNMLSLSANNLIFGDNEMINFETAEHNTIHTESDLSLPGSSRMDTTKKPTNKKNPSTF